MSTISHYWRADAPPKPDVYTTRKGESRYHTLRYWDGARWWQLEWGGGRATKKFTWPKGSRTRFPSGMSRYRDSLSLRTIGDKFQRGIQWGEPFRVFSREEVLKWMVKKGYLHSEWEHAYQAQMREDHSRGAL